MQPDLSFILLRALESPLGVKLRTNNPQLLRNKLYAAKRKEEAFAVLSIVQPPVGSDSYLWIIKKDARRAPEIDG